MPDLSATRFEDHVQAVLPAFDEEATVGAVVRGLRSLGLRRIRIVDNGSTDATAARAIEAGAEVVSEPRRGYGRACHTGLQGLPDGVEWILFCDADGSDELDDWPQLAAAAECADLVIGNRRATAEGRRALTLLQNFGNALACALLRLGWGAPQHDLGPFRLVRRKALERLGLEDRGFGWTIEMQARAAECGLRVEEVAVRYRPRQGGKSKISGSWCAAARAGAVILGTVAKLAWRRWRRGLAAWLENSDVGP